MRDCLSLSSASSLRGDYVCHQDTLNYLTSLLTCTSLILWGKKYTKLMLLLKLEFGLDSSRPLEGLAKILTNESMSLSC